MQACDRCHARKTRCDRRIPQCTGCEKANVPCVHADKLRQRNLPRAYLDNMENLVKQLREENKTLRENLTSAQAQIEARALAANDQTTNSSPMSQPSQLQEGPISPGTSNSSPDTNAFAVEVGYLTLIGIGEARYLGSSSGLGLANMINTIVGIHGGMGISPADHSDPGNPSSPRIPTGPSDPLFPPLPTAMPFIEAYFQHTHLTFPLLHRPSFQASVDRIYSEPNFYETNKFDAFVFDMVLTIGSSNFNRFEEASANSALYFAMAHSKITSIATKPSLESLKTLLLISQHGIFSNLRETTANIWHLAGLGARMCFELGLHLEPKSSKVDLVDSLSVRKVTLDEEMRKRCFWCLYNLDRIVSMTLGRPFIIRDDEIDVTLPSHLDDNLFGTDRPIEIDLLEPSSPGNTSPFSQLIQIRRLSGRILTLMYISRQNSQVPLDEKRRVRGRLHDEIDAWKRATERLSLVRTESRSFTSSFLSPEWYTAVYCNAILLLYRPSPYLPEPTMVSSGDGKRPELICLLDAAKGSIKSYSELHRKRQLNYSWITLHGIFIAGLAYIYTVSKLLHDPSTRQLAPSLMCIIEVTQSCSHVLVAICERWNGSRRSCDLFSKLSNNLIRNALGTVSRENYSFLTRGDIDSSAPGRNGPGSPMRANEPGPSSDPQMHLDEPAIGTSGDGMAPYLDSFLFMENFKDYRSLFDGPFQNDFFTPSEPLSTLSPNWPLDSTFTG